MNKMLKVTQTHSYIGRPQKQRRVLRGLGLGKMNKSVFLQDTPEIRGMINKIVHLVSSEEVRGNE